MREDEEADSEYEDEGPTPDELAQIRNATPQEAAAVDELVLGKCIECWRKVAMVIGSSLAEFDAKFSNLPYIYMQLRMVELVKQGRLEAQGDVMAMRHSEVRVPVRRE